MLIAGGSRGPVGHVNPTDGLPIARIGIRNLPLVLWFSRGGLTLEET